MTVNCIEFCCKSGGNPLPGNEGTNEGTNEATNTGIPPNQFPHLSDAQDWRGPVVHRCRTGKGGGESKVVWGGDCGVEGQGGARGEGVTPPFLGS